MAKVSDFLKNMAARYENTTGGANAGVGSNAGGHKVSDFLKNMAAQQANKDGKRWGYGLGGGSGREERPKSIGGSIKLTEGSGNTGSDAGGHEVSDFLKSMVARYENTPGGTGGANAGAGSNAGSYEVSDFLKNMAAQERKRRNVQFGAGRRPSAGNGSDGTQSSGSTAGSFQWQDVGTARTEMESWASGLTDMRSEIEAKRATAEQAGAELQRAYDEIQRLQGSFALGSDPLITQGYNNTLTRYNTALRAYQTAAREHDALVAEYGTLLGRYESGYNAYTELLSGQRERAAELRAQADALEEENKALAGRIQRQSVGLGRAEAYGLPDSVREKLAAERAAYAENEEKIAQLRAQADQAEVYYYGAIPLMEDYARYSVAGPAKREADDLNLWKVGQERGDDLYDFINDLKLSGDDQLSYREMVEVMSLGANQSDKYGAYTPYSYMTKDEIGIYNYLYATDGKEAADGFLDELMSTLNYRMGVEGYEELSGVGKALYWLPAGLDQFTSGIGQLFSEDALPVSDIQVTSGLVNQEAHEVSPILGTAYELGTMVSNMAPSILLSYVTAGLLSGAGVAAGTAGTVAGGVGNLAMGASAGGNAYAQKLGEGYTKEQARQYGVLIGASEAILQHILGGIGSLGGVTAEKLAAKIAGIDNALARIALSLGVKMSAEGLEEGLQEVLAPAFETLITGEEFELNFEDVAYAYLMGALTAGLLEGGGTVSAQMNRETGFVISDMDGYKAADGTDYFEGCTTLEEVEARYYELARQNHPDLGGSQTVMADINRQRDMQKAFYSGRAQTQSGGQATTQLPLPPLTSTDTGAAPQVAPTPAQAPAQVSQGTQQAQRIQTIQGEQISREGDLPPLTRGTGQQQMQTGLPPLTRQTTQTEQTPDAAAGIQNGGLTNERAYGEDLPGGGSGRFFGARAGEQAGGVASGAEKASRDTEQFRAASARQDRINALRGEKVSSRELGISRGTEDRVVQIAPEESWDDGMRATAERINRETSAAVTYVIGGIQVETPDGARLVRGVYSGDRIIIQADNLRHTTDQIADHEIFHDKVFQTPGLIWGIEHKIRERYGAEEFERVVDIYIEKLRGVIDVPEHDGPERDAAIRDILEEIFADAYAGINAFSAHPERYNEVVEEVLEEHGIGRGSQTAAATDRTTGPPRERYLYAGPEAAGANTDTLDEAERLEMRGVDEETIRQMTGWFRGADRKWRWEIDDSAMEYDSSGNRLGAVDRRWAAEDFEAASEDLFAGVTEEQAAKVRAYNRAELARDEAERRRLARELTEEVGLPFETYVDAHRRAMETRGNPAGGTLADYIHHPELFANYPQLREAKMCFVDLPSGVKGRYDPEQNRIDLSKNIRRAPEDTLIHEIQHAIQQAEGFASGSSQEYWESGSRQQKQEALERIQREIDSLREMLETDEESADFILADIEQLEEALDNLNDYLYRNTAGEIEARDAAMRRRWDARRRREIAPDMGDENTVFADAEDFRYAMNTDERASVKEQLNRSREELDGMAPVAAINRNDLAGLTPGQARVKLTKELKKTGYKVDRPNFGVIQFTEKEINNSLNYKERSADEENARRTAMLALPQVLKRGKEISVHRDHKGRGYGTVTIAAPVIINGKRGNMAVVIRETKGNRYKVHRILTPDGGAFTLEKMDSAEGYPVGGITDAVQTSGEVTPANFLRADNSITQNGRKSNTKFSVEEQEDGEALYRPEGMSDETYAALNEKWKAGADRRRPDRPENYESIDAYAAAARERAAAAKAERMKNIPREDFIGTPALQRLGVKIENSVGIYDFVKSLIANDRAAKSVRKEVHKAERRLNATDAERNFASGIAAGIYTEADIPSSMRADRVMELADYYWAEKAVASDLIRAQRSDINRALSEKMEELFKDSDDFKPSGAIILNNRTPERNMLKIFGDERGAAINAAIFDPVAANEAERYRFRNRMHNEVRTFEDSRGKRSRLTKEERAVVQMVIEGKAVGEIVASMEMAEAIKNAAHNIKNGWSVADAANEFSLDFEHRRLAEKYSRWMQTQEILESGRVDSVKVENAAKKYSELFDLFYEAINDFLVAHGYEPIGFIKGYAPHLQPEGNQTLLSKSLQALGINTNVTRLPSSIAGLTADYKPNKRWNPYFLHRTTDVTKYDIASAFESYVDYMSDVLYHTDDIMRVRQAANYFRRTYAPEEIREKLSQAEELRYGTTEQKANFLRDHSEFSRSSALAAEDINQAMDDYVAKLYEDISNTTKYSELVSYLDNYANILAGKQSMADRGWEYSGGRTVLNLGNRLVRAFGRAQVAGNLSSALNQAAQLPQITAELGARYTTAAIRDIWSGKLRRAGWAEGSDFLTGKRGIKWLVMEPGDMVIDALFTPAQIVDGFMSTIAVRGKYLKEMDAGKTHAEAMKAADSFAKSVMASRMKGSRPLAYEAKNPISQVLHVFQTEAVNQWEHLSQDLPRDFRKIEAERGRPAAQRAMAGVIVKMLIAAFLLNRLDEELYGGTPAPFDILGLSANFIASGEGLTTNQWLRTVIDNGWEKLTGERLFDTDDEALDGEFDWSAALEDTAYNVGNDIPFLRNAMGLLGLGDETLPLPGASGAFTELWEAGKAMSDGEEDVAAKAERLAWALGGAVAELIPGGRQGFKTAQGVQTAIRGGRYYGYGDEKRLQYPVEDDFWSVVRGMLFGNSALEETDAFYASGASGLSAKQTRLYEALVADGADRMEIYNAIQDYRAVSSDTELTSYERDVRARNIIGVLNITDRQKLELYRGLTGSDSRTERFRILMDAGMTWGEAMDIYDNYAKEGNGSVTDTQFYEAISGTDISEREKAAAIGSVMGTEMTTEAGNPTQYAKMVSVIDAGLTVGDYLTLKEIGGVDEFLKQVEAGVEPRTAFEAVQQISAIKEAAGEGATALQLYRAAVDAGGSDREQMAALRGLMTDSEYAKLDVGYEYGISPRLYVITREQIAEIDANGRVSQEEAADAIGRLLGLSSAERAILWQLQNKSWKPKNNPFDPSVGERVYQALQAGGGNESGEESAQLPELSKPEDDEIPWISLPGLDD